MRLTIYIYIPYCWKSVVLLHLAVKPALRGRAASDEPDLGGIGAACRGAWRPPAEVAREGLGFGIVEKYTQREHEL